MVENKVFNGQEDISKMSRFFEIIVKSCLLPLTKDLTKKKLTFKFCSRPSAIFLVIICIVTSVTNFSFFYMIGFDKVLKFWRNMLYQSNTTDFITYVVLISSTFSYAMQYKIFYDIPKISDELLLSKDLQWPKKGKLLLSITIFCTISQTMWGVISFLARVEIDYIATIFLILAYSVFFLYSQIIMFVLIIFILAWMETFSKKCIELSANCIRVEQGKICIDHFISRGIYR